MNERQTLGALWVNGDDAASFLNGQLTINVAALLHQQWLVGAYCSHQGKVIAVVAVLALATENNNGYLLLMSADLVDTVATNLRKYVMRSKVLIEPLPIYLFVNKSPSRELIAGQSALAIAGPLPALMGDENANIVHLSGLGDVQLSIDLSPDLSLSKKNQNAQLLKQTLIQHGIAMIGSVTSEQFVPQMLGLHKVGGIDFDKGCYVGQEVIARMHYKGKVRRHLAWTEAEQGLGDELLPNTVLYCHQRKAATVLAYVDNGETAIMQVVIHQGLIDKPLQLPDDDNHHFIFTSERTSL